MELAHLFHNLSQTYNTQSQSVEKDLMSYYHDLNQKYEAQAISQQIVAHS